MQQQAAFVQIISQHEGLIYKISRIYTNGEDEQKDLYQEIVYQLWKSYGSYKGKSGINTWVYRVALNTAITQLNKRKRKPIAIPLDWSQLEIEEVADPVHEERLQLLYHTIKSLNPIEKGLILLYLEGKSYEEMAMITGFTTTNIGTRLGRIRQKLKSRMITQ